MPISLAILLGIILPLAILVTILGVCVRIWRSCRDEAKQFGYATMVEYLRAVPFTDAEKKQAVDMALKGLVLCLLGLVFPPLLLFGVFPLFFGVRKIAWASMGLGLADNPDEPTR